MKKALITGVAGQDGSYLAELLLKLGYMVYGTVREISPKSRWRIDHLLERERAGSGLLKIIEMDLTNPTTMGSLLEEVKPDEAYNLAAQSHIVKSNLDPKSTYEINALGAESFFEAIRLFSPATKTYQASSSEIFGSSPPPQNESSDFQPTTPYGSAKLYAYEKCKLYREKHQLFFSSGILFNHESPRRSLEFVTRKITHTAAMISRGLASQLELGDLDATRDWGYAPDYVFAMWKMLQLDEPEDFVISTGTTVSVSTFVEEAFRFFDLDWTEYTVSKPELRRPNLVSASKGDFGLARSQLGWSPSVFVSELIQLMCEAELSFIDNFSPPIDVPRSNLWPY